MEGFNLRRWMSTNKKRIPPMLETLAKLVNADKLRVNFTEVRGGIPTLGCSLSFLRRRG